MGLLVMMDEMVVTGLAVTLYRLKMIKKAVGAAV